MKWTLCFFILFLLFNQSNAQCDSQYFRYTASFITDVSLIDTSTIIGVGDNGYVIKSKDGGNSWKNIQTFNSSELYAIQMVTDSIGFAVGYLQTILKTEDQGEHWFPLLPKTTAALSSSVSSFSDLYFFNKDRGYIVGSDGMGISTNDGGKTWFNLYIDPLNDNDFGSINFINDSTGFVTGSYGTLFKTENRGQTWQHITIPGIGSSDGFSKIRFIDSLTGFIIGGNSLCLKTIDGGTTWEKITTPVEAGLFDICFLSATKGFILGQNGAIGLLLQTDDGGNTWTTVLNYPDSKYASYYSINADRNKQKMIIAGGGGYSEFSGYNGRNILSTIDSAATFTTLSRNGRLQYYDVFFLNDSTGYITGEGGITYKTSDYAETWKPLHNVPSSYNDPTRKIVFLDSLHGFASTDNVYKTIDGGNTWVMTPTQAGEHSFFASQMKFYDTLKGLVQDNQSIYKTINGGTTWTNVATSSTFFTDFAITTNGKAFAVGYGGKLDISTDEGTTWTPYNLNTTKYLTSIYFYNDHLGFIGTADSTIFKTIDGGNTWTTLVNLGLQSSREIRSFYFVNDSIGYIMCSNGISDIYKTINGGLSWFLLKEVIEPLSSIQGVNQPYIAGGDGMILKMEALQKPTLPGYIYGPDKACLNTKSSFITGTMAGVNYNWLLINGGTNSYQNNKDTVLWINPGTYTLSLTVSNACGVSETRTIIIDVIQFLPSITVQDSILTATEGLAYYWYRDGIFIPTSPDNKSRSIIARIDGSYTVWVTSPYGCSRLSPAISYAGLPKQICPNGNTSIATVISSGTYQWQRNDGTGFVNIFDDTNYAGTNTSLLQISNIPSSWYGYKFRCNTSAGYSDVYSLLFTDNWIGLTDTAWENPANWSCNKIPDANTDVIINGGTVVINSNVTIRKLTMNPSTNLTIQPGKTLTIIH